MRLCLGYLGEFKWALGNVYSLKVMFSAIEISFCRLCWIIIKNYAYLLNLCQG